jgi:hypothetical protein
MNRKAFNFYRSYYDVGCELSDKDRLAFYDAIITLQFTAKLTPLKGVAKFAFLSQKHSIDAQIKGYYDKTKDPMFTPYEGGTQGGWQQEEEKGQEKVQVQEEVKEECNTLDLLITKSELELTFDSYLEMRKQIKKPATPYAINLIKKKLVQMTQNNEYDMCELLNQSIVNSWVDIYPIKNTFVKKDKPTMRTTNEVFDEISRKIKSGEIDTTIYPIL